jgi:hypothetical protein
MSSKLQVSIPQAASWRLRLAAHPQLSDNLCRDAVAFSAWYAAANGLLDWPDEVEAIRRTERAKKLSLDRVMKLLAQMNHTFSGRASAEQAKLLLEGYAVHDWVSDNSLVFRALAAGEQETLGALDDISDQAREAISPFAARLRELGRILGLTALEQEILAFAVPLCAGVQSRSGTIAPSVRQCAPSRARQGAAGSGGSIAARYCRRAEFFYSGQFYPRFSQCHWHDTGPVSAWFHALPEAGRKGGCRSSSHRRQIYILKIRNQ